MTKPAGSDTLAPAMSLNDEQLRAVLARAEEIHNTPLPTAAWNADIQTVLDAAEDLGLSRTAIERALAERRDLFPEPPRVGQLTWARSTDDKYYVAEVLDVSRKGAHVRFLRGGEISVGADGLRPCGFLPGERVECDWPWWGQWTATVIGYDAVRRTVRVTDGWGMNETFDIADVWIAPKKTEPAGRTRFIWKVAAIGAAVGAVVGAVATLVILR
jgi:hypothetical protein